MLHNGDHFPPLTFTALNGGTISVPGDLSGSYGVVLFYRGSWCPFCNEQLAAFSKDAAKLSELGIKVVAASVDDQNTTHAFAEKNHVTFPLGYGADADKVAAATGAFTNAKPHYLQPTGYVLDPEGKIINEVYSSGAIGRLLPDDVARLVTFVKSRK